MFPCRSCLALIAASMCLPAYAGQRAFVSSTGNDANLSAGCTLAAPCRTFQTAHAAVDAGGEIVALDAAGYAPVTITKSVSILANPGVAAGITVASGNGVTIATPGVAVVLRNLNINGTGGNFGIRMTAGDSLSVENCVVSSMSTGIGINAAADVRIVDTIVRGSVNTGVLIEGNASADIAGSRLIGNGGIGVVVAAGVAGTTAASINDTVSSGNLMGFFANATAGGAVARASFTRSTAANNTTAGFSVQAAASATALMSVGNSMASGNSVGFNNAGGAGTATLESLGDNILSQNTTQSAGTVSSFAAL